MGRCNLCRSPLGGVACSALPRELEQRVSPVFILIEIGLSQLMGLAFNASGGAVLVAILMHSAFNSSRFLDPFLGDTPTREIPSAEIFLAFAFLAMGALAVVITRGRLRTGETQSTSIVPG